MGGITHPRHGKYSNRFPPLFWQAGVSGGEGWSIEDELMISDYKTSANKNEWLVWSDMLRAAHDTPGAVDPRIPAQLMFDFLEELREPLLPPEAALMEVLELESTGNTMRSTCYYPMQSISKLDMTNWEIISCLSLLFGGTGTFDDARVVNYSGLAGGLRSISSCHYGVRCVLEKLIELLRLLKGNVKEEPLRRAYIRTGVAVTQLSRAYGSMIMNGRDLVYIPPFKDFRSTIKTLRMMESPVLEKTVHQIDMLDKLLAILVDGWQKMPKTLVGSPMSTARANNHFPPLNNSKNDLLSVSDKRSGKSKGSTLAEAA